MHKKRKEGREKEREVSLLGLAKRKTRERGCHAGVCMIN
jgi:hypothetical protein